MHSDDQRHPLGGGRPARRRSERGQGLVEFMLMTLFLSILLMGVLDLGRAYFTYLALKDAAQEGAYYGSAFPQCVAAGSAPACADPNNIPFRLRHSAPSGGLVDWTGSGAVVTIALPPVMQDGQSLTVTVSYQYQMLTPFVGTIANGQILTLTAQSSAVIVRVPNCSVAPTCQ
jgi:Flp pilus assembly protein TadG